MRRHIDGWRPSSGVLVGVLALVAAVAGTAVAGPGATTSKLSKKKVVKIADREINKLAPGLSVAHAQSANTATHADTATSADKAVSADAALSARSALSANTADSVGGVSIQPVSIAMIDGPSFAEPLHVNGSTVNVVCLGSTVQLEINRGGSSPPISGQWIRDGLSPLVRHPPPGSGNGTSGGVLGLTATVREASGRVTRMTVDAFYETNAFGGSEDCFVQGTIERFG
jgi:hypothetical protein